MNELQACEFNILTIFVSLCEKFSLRYFAVGGTLLGTVRHEGFIPWDDDIDLGMPRPDYEKFLQLAQDNLPDGYFLQTYDTDPAYIMGFAKIRNSNTTLLEIGVQNKKMNHGVYIDIFPFDGYKPSRFHKFMTKTVKMLALNLINDTFYYAQPPQYSKKERATHFLSKLIYRNAQTAVRKWDAFNKKIPFDTSAIAGCYFGLYKDREFLPRQTFGCEKTGTFEGFPIKIPDGTHEYLSSIYGNYMQLPPLEKQKPHHDYVTLDLTKGMAFNAKEYQK